MAKNNTSENAPSINFLGNGTSIKGDINSNGDFRIDGHLTGSITAKGKVVVGTSGKVEGDIICQNADISGALNAKIVVHELLTLKASAQINGDIYTNKLAIEPGAKFTGSCNMRDIPKEAHNLPPKNEKKESPIK